MKLQTCARSTWQRQVDAYMTNKFLSVILSEFTYAIQPVTDTKQFMNVSDPGNVSSYR